jgi:ankyrin repeat protein
LPLHHALGGPDDEFFLLLLEHTRKLDQEDGQGQTVSERAVEMNLPGHVSKLLATKRVDIMKRNKEGLTLLAVAAGSGSVSREMLELLYSANPTLVIAQDDTPDRWTSLHHALMASGPHREEKIKYLLSLPESRELVLSLVFHPGPAQHKYHWSERLYAFAQAYDLQERITFLLNGRSLPELLGLRGRSHDLPSFWNLDPTEAEHLIAQQSKIQDEMERRKDL